MESTARSTTKGLIVSTDSPISTTTTKTQSVSTIVLETVKVGDKSSASGLSSTAAIGTGIGVCLVVIATVLVVVILYRRAQLKQIEDNAFSPTEGNSLSHSLLLHVVKCL